MFGSRVLLVGAAALALGAGVVSPASAAPGDDTSCADVGHVRPGTTVDCNYDGLRVKVRALDRDCLVLVKIVGGERQRGPVGTTADEVDRRASELLVGIHLGDCRNPVTPAPAAPAEPSIPGPVPSAPQAPVEEAPVTEAPAPQPVEAHLPVTH